MADPEQRQGAVRILDARGLSCPMPLVKAKLVMEELGEGEELLVMATDPEAAIDLAAWATDAGHLLRERDGGEWSEFLLTKRSTRR
jgi:tRNA 2-thiouridine synthesizing protein A